MAGRPGQLSIEQSTALSEFRRILQAYVDDFGGGAPAAAAPTSGEAKDESVVPDLPDLPATAALLAEGNAMLADEAALLRLLRARSFVAADALAQAKKIIIFRARVSS